jgi:hypothetical protein
MAKIKNKRLDFDNGNASHGHQNKVKKQKEKKHRIKDSFNSIKSLFSELPLDLKLFFTIMFVVIVAGIISIAMFTNGILQSGLMVVFLAITIIASLMFSMIRNRSKYVIVTTVAMFCVLLTLVSFFMELYIAFGIKENIQLNIEISEIKKSSEEIITTDFANIYLNLDEMSVYSISDIENQKYINKNTLSPSEESEYYSQAKKLLDLLQYFEPITSKAIPNNSIIREFIGGSCFEL